MFFYTRPAAATALVLLLSVGACVDAPTPLVAPEKALSPEAPMVARINADLAAVRRVTAPLHQLEDAIQAGWSLPVTGCVENPPEGGMGYHYGNLGFYLDGEANVLEPEILLYEPQPGGTLRLVAVEYIVPLFAWQGSGAPVLFGREMKWVEAFQEWQLHVWIWKHNPSGMFADWNPKVRCFPSG